MLIVDLYLKYYNLVPKEITEEATPLPIFIPLYLYCIKALIEENA